MGRKGVRRLVALLALGIFALGWAASVSATTAPDLVTKVRVTLTNASVLFAPKNLRPDTDTTFVVQVVNRASSQRWFSLAGRQTTSLQPGGKQYFYYSFSFAGTIHWKSGGANGKLFAGEIAVHPAPPLGQSQFG